MIEAANYALVRFEGRTIMCAMVNGEVVVPVRPVAQQFGLPWSAQHKGIQGNSNLSKGVRIVRFSRTVGAHSGREMLCLTLPTFHGWLLQLHPDRIRSDEARALVSAYKERAFDVITEYFHGTRAASRPANAWKEQQFKQTRLLKLMASYPAATNVALRAAVYHQISELCRDTGTPLPTPADLLDTIDADPRQTRLL